MKPTSRVFLAAIAVAVPWLTAGSMVEAVPPLPQARIDPVHRETPVRIEMLYVLPEWAHAELANPLSVNEHGMGYFARSLRELVERDLLGDKKGGARDAKGTHRKSKGARGGSDAPSKPERPSDPVLVDEPGGSFGDLPIFPDPLHRPVGKKPPDTGRPETAEVPEPAMSTLLAMAIAGWLASVRPRRRR